MDKVDVLAFGAHPDDVELGAGGTIAKLIADGKSVGMVDLTRGELGTRGTAEIRDNEARAAAEILGVSFRINLEFRDGFFVNDEKHQLEIVKVLRKYRPEICIVNAPHDRHPDHGEGSELLVKAAFLSGLRKVETVVDTIIQEVWRPKALYHYIQFLNLEPDLIVDVSEHVETKMNSIKAYKSQFFDRNSKEPATVISSKEFLDSVENRAMDMGRLIGKEYGEAFVVDRNIGVHSLFDLI
ncbi:MAG: bacillithiol biosynthesis deacetylase BshB1 [Candidatus Azotimanducaceae bacterium]|jgi:bacillithiol biosynthesis deacetylase BshB1